jgi:hypothetical protein
LEKLLAAFFAVLVLINLGTLVMAYPETKVIDSGCCSSTPALAKDFSAFYTAAWRLLHDPSQVYVKGYLGDGEFQVLPQPEQYKYLPSFLLLAIPFLALPYQSALTAFDVAQFLLLPGVALLLYQLLKDRGRLTILVVSVLTLVLPLPIPTAHLSLSAPYYWQWAEGQSKVLETFLFLLAFYLGDIGMPKPSGVVFALAAFDPRIAVLALPLFAAYNHGRRAAYAVGGVAFAAFNFTLFYPPIASGFYGMVVTTGVITPPFYYTLIPAAAFVSLIYVERSRIAVLARGYLGKSRQSPERWKYPDGEVPRRSTSQA